MNEDWEGEELVDIEDPSLPDALREHAGRFKIPTRSLSLLAMVNMFYMLPTGNCWICVLWVNPNLSASEQYCSAI